jgi:transcriptional regulator with XRE-family HTH domain
MQTLSPLPISERLAAWRKSLDIGKAEAARRLGVSVKSIERWEAGRPVHRMALEKIEATLSAN